MRRLGVGQDSSRAEGQGTVNISEPPELKPFLEKFRKDHPERSDCVFLMMRFGSTAPHENIVRAVKNGLAQLGKRGIRADDRNYAPQIWPNIQTYLHGCGSGLAIFDRIEADEINPNVSLECGYMLGLGKPLCLLKDKTLKVLQTDLTGHIYRSFDPHNAESTILTCLKQWFRDEGWQVPDAHPSD